MNRIAISLLAAVSAFVAPGTVGAEIGVDVHFSTSEISIIRAYYEEHRDGNKPARKGARQLPPGIAKNLGRGKPLPPGIAKQYLPGDLIARLPPVPRGFERLVIGGKVLLVEAGTQIIHDVLTDIVFD